MKTLITIISIVVILAMAIAVLPASALTVVGVTGVVDNSGLFVWAFLGFCVTIILAQVVPAVLLLTGICRGAASVVCEK